MENQSESRSRSRDHDDDDDDDDARDGARCEVSPSTALTARLVPIDDENSIGKTTLSRSNPNPKKYR